DKFITTDYLQQCPGEYFVYFSSRSFLSFSLESAPLAAGCLTEPHAAGEQKKSTPEAVYSVQV
ncbi:TPA: hypothetical protein ACHUV3_004528, partial [Shigella sonnei]